MGVDEGNLLLIIIVMGVERYITSSSCVEILSKIVRARECFYDSPPSNRRLHETENNEYLPLQAAIFFFKHDKLAFQ